MKDKMESSEQTNSNKVKFYMRKRITMKDKVKERERNEKEKGE